MFHHHPYLKQECRKAVNTNNTSIRSKLYQAGRHLHPNAIRLLNSLPADTPLSLSQLTDIANMAGSIDTYIMMRKAITPDIGLDQYTNNLAGILVKLREKLSQQHAHS